MRKLLYIFILTLLSVCGYGQVYQSMPQYGYGPVKRFWVDSTLSIPTVCGVPTLKSYATKQAAIAFDSCNNRFYFYNPKTLAWDTIKGGGVTIDTTSLSGRIELRLKISDTAAMLQPYLLKVDTSNKWVNSVTKLNDSTIRVIKDGTTTDITLTSSSTVTSASRLSTSVYNNSGSTISKGSVVYINGRHSSNLPTVALAKADKEENSYKTFALIESDISNSASGTAIQIGNIGNLALPTGSYSDGDIVYLSPSTAGGITTTKPTAPNHIVKLGTITRAHPTLGSININIQNGWQLDELSDVKISAVPNDSTLLQFSRVDSLWHDVSVTTAIGGRYIKPSDTASMLTNYAKKNYFNLQNVTANGNTTTNDIFANSINVYDQGNEGYSKMDGNSEGFRFYDINSNEIFDITQDQISLVKPTSGTIAAINSGYITGNRYFYLPDITGTFAMRGDSTLFQTKYRTDTARINIYSSINGKVKYSDTAAMLTNYFKSANYDNVYIKGMQAAGSTIKGTNMAVPYYNLISQTTALTNAQMRVVLIYLPNAATLTGIKFYTAGGTNNAGTFNGVALYKVRSGNDSADLVASCANDTSLFEPATANSWVTKAFTSTYSASAGLYYAAIICSYNTGTPSVGTSAALANTGVVSNMDISPNKISAVVNSQTSFGSKFGLTQFTSVGTLPAIYIY